MKKMSACCTLVALALAAPACGVDDEGSLPSGEGASGASRSEERSGEPADGAGEAASTSSGDPAKAPTSPEPGASPASPSPTTVPSAPPAPPVSPPVRCAGTPGYSDVPGISFTASAGSFAGSHTFAERAPLFGVLGGNGGAHLAEWVGKHIAMARNAGGLVGDVYTPSKSVMLGIDAQAIAKGGSYPLVFTMGEGGGQDGTALKQPYDGLPGSSWNARYPGDSPGACTLTVDAYVAAQAATPACVRARFSCTGLVTVQSGVPLAITGGTLVAGS